MRFLLFVLTLLLPATASAQLSGTYTIGGASPDYPTIEAAMDDLDDFGLSGPVTFLLRPGVYSERINPGALGTSATNTFEIRSEDPNNRAEIKVDATAANNYVWRVLNTDFVTFRDIDFIEANNDGFGRILVIEGDSDNITIEGCAFSGRQNAMTSAGTLLYAVTNQVAHLTVTGSTFTNGYRGIDAGDGATPYPPGHVYRANTFSGQYDAGVYALGVSALIDANAISDAAGTASSYTAIVGLLATSSEITRNDIRVTQGRRGIRVSLTPHKLIANNSISLRSPNGEAGIYLDGNAWRVDVFHNTVRVGSATGTGVALFKEDFGTGAFDIDIKNNLLQHYASGTVLEIEDPAEIESLDYNNLFRTGGGTLVAWGGTNYANLADYQSGTGQGANSVSKAVTFADASGGDLHLAGASEDDFDLAGTPAGIAEDIDGDARAPMSPKMGADEGVPFFPLEGTYSVGFAGISDFDDPFEAVDYLNTFGTAGPVLFDILAFDYTGNAVIEDFTRFGAPTDVVTFRGNFIDEPGFPRPTLINDATAGANNFIFRITSADYLAFEDLEFETGGGTAPFGRAIQLNGGVADVSFSGNTFTGLATDATDAFQSSLVSVSGSGSSRITFDNNTFDRGIYGVYGVPTISGGSISRFTFTSNTFTEQRLGGIVLERCSDPVIEDNTLTSTPLPSAPLLIQLRDGTGGSITGNHIMTTAGISSSGGISIRNHDGTASDPILVANNFVSTGGFGITTTGVDYLRVYHNTVRQTFPGAIAYLIFSAGSNHELLNNIFIGGGGLKPAVDIEAPSAIVVSDYNNILTKGSVLVSWGDTTYADLAAYQAGTGLDPNSVSKSVNFVDVSTGDLHLTGPSDGDDDLAGTPLVEVPQDIDGQDRGTPPYMGADEASGLTPPPNYDLVATNATPLTVAPGGAVSFDYSITNNTANPASGQLWFAVPAVGFQGVIVSGTLPAGQTFNGSYTQNVPGNAPPGVYTYNLNIGTFPGLIVDTESFSITVTAARPAADASTTWSLRDVTPWPSFDQGTTDESPEAASETLPETFALDAAYPNPFARSTTIGFALPEMADVKVAVYDMLGREVAVLVDTPMEAGRHTAAFGAAGLASGVYLVRMTAGSYAEVQRVTLAR